MYSLNLQSNFFAELVYPETNSEFSDILSGEYFLEYVIGNFFFPNYFDYFQYDYDIIIKFRYNFCNLDIIDFVFEGASQDMSKFIVYDSFDLRNNYF